MKKLAVALLALSFTLLGCEQDIPFTFAANYDFTNGLDGWQVDYADFPAANRAQFQLSSELALLPSPLDTNKPALKVEGTNRSDDLMMYAYRVFEGLRPDTEYAVLYQVQIASQYPENAVGIGGSPGANVYLKAGAKAEAPVTSEDGQGFVRLSNWDVGNQANGGSDAVVLGSIGIEGDVSEWTLIEQTNANQELLATSDAEGRLWFFVATDSGFEGTTTVFYSRINVNLAEVR